MPEVVRKISTRLAIDGERAARASNGMLYYVLRYDIY
jgi:hypothetical protein